MEGVQKVLAVFPHADDETVTCGGTLRRLADAGVTVTLLLLTAGERGNPRGMVDPMLKSIRHAEVERAARILGISRVIYEDFGDGRLQQQAQRVVSSISAAIDDVRPDLIVTYDLSGLDGHDDHVACSELVTAHLKERHPQVRLWYVALPGWLLALLMTVGQMQRDADLDRRRATPSRRIFIGRADMSKIRAWRAYRSQRGAIGKGLGRLIPSWLPASLLPFEYFADAG